MENNFTISKGTNELLAIYRDFSKVSNRLYTYFFEESNPDDGECANDKADELFKPFNESVQDIREKLSKLISTRIEWAMDDGESEI
jgi:hypothetical protein